MYVLIITIVISFSSIIITTTVYMFVDFRITTLSASDFEVPRAPGLRVASVPTRVARNRRPRLLRTSPHPKDVREIDYVDVASNKYTK